MSLFTSESVTAGHPDKLCDQISDALLDAYLAQDPDARTGIETMATASGIILGGEINSHAQVNHEAIVERVIRSVGYEDLYAYTLEDRIIQQSPEIHQGVDREDGVLGAGDQGMMFGYATVETRSGLPTPIALARSLTDRITEARTTGLLPWLRPDGKAQVTMNYDGAEPTAVETIVVSVSHEPDIDLQQVRSEVFTEIVLPALGDLGWALPTTATVHVNPAGAWSLCGPLADAGLTGRKIIADTYGGMARHGGGAFSGKDPSKVDRSAAYAARHAALYLIDSQLAGCAEVQLSYAIGVDEPVSVRVETFGTSFGQTDETLAAHLSQMFDFTPQGIIDKLDLQQTRYEQTAREGHFGLPVYPWEQTSHLIR